MAKTFQRSESYRAKFIRHNPPKHGHYTCVYCGKWIKKEDMQVDHVVAVNRAKKNKMYRLLIYDDINELSNLVPSCRSCNHRKGDKGGLWVLRGKFWRIFLPIHIAIRVFFLLIGAWFLMIVFDIEPAIRLMGLLINHIQSTVP